MYIQLVELQILLVFYQDPCKSRPLPRPFEEALSYYEAGFTVQD